VTALAPGHCQSVLLWASRKGTGLANLAGDTLDDVLAAAERGFQRIRATPNLPFRFCAAADGPHGENHVIETTTFVDLARAGSR
jgi:hypothetical protein